MTAPEPKRDQPAFETFKLGWRIPPAILEPLLHPAASADQRDVAPDTPAPPPERD